MIEMASPSSTDMINADAWGASGSWLEISRWISTAHCAASTTLANSAITASP
jgi:hypothetical protein